MAAVNRRAPQRALTRRDNEFMGDLAAWERENGEDNSEQLERLRRNLRRVRRAELTPRQAQLLHLYYDLGYSMSGIAGELGIDKSTVSRTISRGRERLKRYLQYSL
ncbi:MAG: sigma-70 family RNA polymerase sigma factor [Oscillospiraceae bacterium]|nr:sigma-70 family RNA polymerase sigma factor [Oscillospiraceae bacterium]